METTKKVELSNGQRKKLHKAFYIDNIPMPEREALCNKLGISYKKAYMTAYHFEKKLKRNKENKPNVGKVEVTHITKPSPLMKATIKVGNAQVEIPGNSISIDGVKLEW